MKGKAYPADFGSVTANESKSCLNYLKAMKLCLKKWMKRINLKS